MGQLKINDNEQERWDTYSEGVKSKLTDYAEYLTVEGETVSLSDVETARAFGF